jgi:hypothetical protein
MQRKSLRAFIAVTAALAVLIVSSSIAFASIQSKTILTTNGLCVNSGDPPTLADGTTPCGAAVYGADGFTGTITYSADEIGTSASVVDFMCTHTVGDATFKSFAGTYTLTIKTTGGATLATASEAVAGGQDCIDSSNPTSGGSATFTVPATGVVQYSILISGVTSQTCPTLFAGFNSIRNGALDLSDGSHANSPSVAPCGTPPFIPEAPFAALLVLTGGALAAVYVARRSGFHFSAPRSA